MLELVTVAEAREHLRLDYVYGSIGPDDDWLAIMISAVSQAVALWLKDSWRLYVPEVDSDGNVVLDSDGKPVPHETSDGKTVHPSVRAAVLIELASQYRFREGEGKDNAMPLDAGYVLNKASTALLTPLRKPTAA